jgi:hypothetical protein
MRAGIPTVARSSIGADCQLRGWLTEQRSEFRRLMAATLLEDSAESAEFAFRECAKGVDPLIAGEAVRLSRYELPVGHPQAPPHGGRPTDALELGADDVIRPVPSGSTKETPI